ncbi:MAG: oligosaccharide flippase family protein [Candidatus Tectomicrobia bacterium]|nr:oligosaccharide flippase family protein [Candidatus Tectomicrobia bacterium]
MNEKRSAGEPEPIAASVPRPKPSLSLTERTVVLVAHRYLSRVLFIITTALLVRLFSEEVYGTYRQLFLVGNFCLVLFRFSLPTSLMYFVPQAERIEDKRRFAGQTVVLLTLFGLLAYGLLTGLAELLAYGFGNPLLTESLRIFAIWVGLSIASRYFNLLMYALERIGPTIAYNLGAQIVNIIILAVAFYFRAGLLTYLYLLVALEGVKWLTAFALAWGLLGGLSFRMSPQSIRQQLGYAGPLAVSQITSRLSYDIDLLMVSYVYPVQDFALYAIGAFELPLVKILRKTGSTVSLPRMVGLFRDGHVDEVLALFQSVVRKTTILALPCFVFLLVMAEPFIEMFYTSKYLGSVPIFRVYLLLIPLSCAAFDVLIRVTGQTRPVMRLALIYMGIAIPLNVIAIYTLGLIGPAIATVLCKLYIAFAHLRVVSQQLQRPIRDLYPFVQSAQILLASIVAMLPAALLSRLAPNAFGQCLLAAVVFFPLCLAIFMYARIVSATDLAPFRKWLGTRWRVTKA